MVLVLVVCVEDELGACEGGLLVLTTEERPVEVHVLLTVRVGRVRAVPEAHVKIILVRYRYFMDEGALGRAGQVSSCLGREVVSCEGAQLVHDSSIVAVDAVLVIEVGPTVSLQEVNESALAKSGVLVEAHDLGCEVDSCGTIDADLEV